MSTIETLTKAFIAVCSAAECEAIINTKRIACGPRYLNFETSDQQYCPARIVAKFRGDTEKPCKVYGSTILSIEIFCQMRRSVSSSYVPDSESWFVRALEEASQLDVRQAAKLAFKHKSGHNASTHALLRYSKK